MTMKCEHELVTLIRCYRELNESEPDARLTNLVGLAIRRASRIMTDKQADHKAAKNAKFDRDLKTVYDRDGKLSAIRDYRQHYGCGLKEAKDAVERLFPYVSQAYNQPQPAYDSRQW